MGKTSFSGNWLRRALIIVGCTAAGAAWLAYKGPMPVVRIMTALPETVPFWYMLSAFPVLGILLADLADLYESKGLTRPTLEFALQLVLVIVLSNLRLGIRLPVSGHSLVVSYLIARRLLLRQDLHRIALAETVFACCILAILAYTKLVWWTDPVTLFAGCALGGALAASTGFRTPAPSNPPLEE